MKKSKHISVDQVTIKSRYSQSNVAVCDTSHVFKELCSFGHVQVTHGIKIGAGNIPKCTVLAKPCLSCFMCHYKRAKKSGKITRLNCAFADTK